MTMLLADTARTAGRVTGAVIGLAIGVLLLVYGIRKLNPKPGQPPPNRALAITAIVVGALVLLGSLGAAAANGG